MCDVILPSCSVSPSLLHTLRSCTTMDVDGTQRKFCTTASRIVTFSSQIFNTIFDMSLFLSHPSIPYISYNGTEGHMKCWNVSVHTSQILHYVNIMTMLIICKGPTYGLELISAKESTHPIFCLFRWGYHVTAADMKQ